MAELSKAMEQYLEAIYALQKEWGEASVTDIAEARGVKAPSVTYVLRKLKTLGLINYKRYQSVSLTSKGTKLAKKLETTHDTLRWFLELIGVSKDVADDEACELEHIVQAETLEKLTQFVEWVRGAPGDPRWLEHFRAFQKTGVRSDECTMFCSEESKK